MTKSQYDGYRQSVYNQGAHIVDQHDAYQLAGQLNATALTFFISELEQLMESFRIATEQTRNQIEASWLDPRFHDYYDFFMNIASTWRTQLFAMQTGGPVPVVTTPATSGSSWSVAPSGQVSPTNVSVTTSVPGYPSAPSLLDGGGVADEGSFSSAVGGVEEAIQGTTGVSSGMIALGLLGAFLLLGRR